MRVLSVPTGRRVELLDVTGQIAAALADEGLRRGAALVFVPHTTAGVTINENADPSVRRDLETTLARMAPPDLPYTHLEGNADAHVKASLMGSSVAVPVEDGRLQLGTWQGIFFAEFDGPRRRSLWVQFLPAPD
ncbi:MAG: YjbQ family protein [Actinobacteria bacterium]|nr:YjbQ family protein [Actinomycetota bacterium]